MPHQCLQWFDFFVLLGSDTRTRKYTTTLYSVYLLNSSRSLTLSQTILGFYVSAVQLYKSVENTVGNGELARNKQFLHFSQSFLPVLETFFHFYQVRNCCLQTLYVWKSLNLSFDKELTHSHTMTPFDAPENKPLVLRICCKVF